MICYAFKIIAKNTLRAVQDFNAVSLLLHYFQWSCQYGNCVLYRDMRKLWEVWLKERWKTSQLLNETTQKRFQQSSNLLCSWSSWWGVTGNRRTCITAIATCSIYLKISEYSRSIILKYCSPTFLNSVKFVLSNSMTETNSALEAYSKTKMCST